MSAALAKKIAAILAKAKSTTFEAEAASLMAKAEQLMREHGIEALDVENADDPLELDTDGVRISGRAWQSKLFYHVAVYYGCDVMFTHHRYGVSATLSGRESARVTVRLMWPYILAAVGRQASAWRASVPRLTQLTQEIAKRSIGVRLTEKIARLIYERDGGFGGEAFQLAEAKLKAAEPDLKISKDRPLQIARGADEWANNIGLSLQAEGKANATLAIGREVPA